MWDLAAAAVWLLILVGWYAAYYHAIQPKRGTLEWIQMYDRQPFTCLGAAEPLVKPDLWWLLGCAAVSIAVRAGLLYWGTAFADLGPMLVLTDIIMPLLGVVGIYVLDRLLGGQALIGALSGLCVLLLPMDPAAGPAILAVALFYGWMSRPADTSFWKNVLWLLPFWLCIGMAAALTPAALWLLPCFGLLWLFAVAQRWRQGYSWGRILLNAFLCLLVLAAMLAACLVFWTVRDGGFAWAELPRAVGDGSLLTQIRLILPGLPGRLLQRPDGVLAQALLDNGLAVMAGIFALIALLHQAFGRRSFRAAYLLMLNLGALLSAGLGGGMVLPAACLSNTAYIAGLLWQREKKIAAVMLPALLLVLETGIYLLG